MQWSTLFKKEMQESWRNRKWIWVPLVLVLISIMDPITTYYLPQIIEMSGGLPEGATIEMPVPSPHEVVMMSLGQLSSLGVLVVVLMSMGAISSERKSGVLELTLVKPVKYSSYITAKWTAYILLVLFSLSVGILVSWYYINLLFGELTFSSFARVVLFYGLWFMLVMTFSIFYNTLFKTAGIVGFLTIGTIMVMSLVTKIFGTYLTWSPNNLSQHLHEMLVTGTVSSDLIATALVSLGLIILLLFGAITIFKSRELAS